MSFLPTGISGLAPLSPLKPLSPSGAISGGDNGFASVMESAIASVENSSSQANQAVQKFLTGDSTDIHSVAIATQRAEVSMELFQQVRNKLVSAYQEVMRTQI